MAETSPWISILQMCDMSAKPTLDSARSSSGNETATFQPSRSSNVAPAAAAPGSIGDLASAPGPGERKASGAHERRISPSGS